MDSVNKLNVTIVIPTIRETSIHRWFEEWRTELRSTPTYNLSILLVEDNPNKTFELKNKFSIPLEHLSWEDIENDLGEHSWIIPRRTDCVRSYGYWRAWKQGADIILTIDDDCYPLRDAAGVIVPNQDYVGTHVKKLSQPVTIREDAWISTIQNIKPRGIPFYTRSLDRTYSNVKINHGLWYNVPDFDAPTSLAQTQIEHLFDYGISMVIPREKYFPMCGMNLAWRADLTPMMYFLLMGQNAQGEHWGFDRFGDIWCGIFAKKILNHLGGAIASGDPIIYHDRASNVFTNLKKEAPGIEVNETLWQKTEAVELHGKTPKDCYKELAQGIQMEGPYWKKLKTAMTAWADLF
ncbi:MAG: hypothetical protein AAB733_04275 [Patescibacteria group bacterium]